MTNINLIYIFAAVVLFVGDHVVNAKPRLKVEIAGYLGSDCPDTGQDILLAGSQAEVVVQVIDPAQTRYTLPTDSAPDNLQLFAGAASHYDENIAYNSIVLRQINPINYSNRAQKKADSLSGYERQTTWNSEKPTLRYLISIPESFGEQWLCVRAEYEYLNAGLLSATDCVQIVSPCTLNDSNNVIGTYVCFAFKSGNLGRAVTLTDSLLKTGWRSWNALTWSWIAAKDIGQYDKSLEFLDVLYTTYGRVSPIGPIDSEKAQIDYNTARDVILAKKNESQH